MNQTQIDTCNNEYELVNYNAGFIYRGTYSKEPIYVFIEETKIDTNLKSILDLNVNVFFTYIDCLTPFFSKLMQNHKNINECMQDLFIQNIGNLAMLSVFNPELFTELIVYTKEHLTEHKIFELFSIGANSRGGVSMWNKYLNMVNITFKLYLPLYEEYKKGYPYSSKDTLGNTKHFISFLKTPIMPISFL